MIYICAGCSQEISASWKSPRTKINLCKNCAKKLYFKGERIKLIKPLIDTLVSTIDCLKRFVDDKEGHNEAKFKLDEAEEKLRALINEFQVVLIERNEMRQNNATGNREFAQERAG